MTEYAGSAPEDASEVNDDLGTQFGSGWFRLLGSYRHSANVGHTDHMYPEFCFWTSVYNFQDRPALDRRSRMVGMGFTGDDRYGPYPSGRGTHAGTRM